MLRSQQLLISHERTVRINTPKLWGRLRQRFGDMMLPEVTSPLPYSAMDLLYLPISDSNPILTKEEFGAFGILGVANWGVLACRPAESHAPGWITGYPP